MEDSTTGNSYSDQDIFRHFTHNTKLKEQELGPNKVSLSLEDSADLKPGGSE